MCFNVEQGWTDFLELFKFQSYLIGNHIYVRQWVWDGEQELEQ